MPACLPSDKIRVEVRLSLEPEYAKGHRPLQLILAVDRGLRHRALKTIFYAMDLHTKTRQKEALRNIGDLMFDYRRLKSLMKKQLTPSQAAKWHKRVAKYASSLLDLLEDERAEATGFILGDRRAEATGSERGHFYSQDLKLQLGRLRAQADSVARNLPTVRKNAGLSEQGKRLPDLAKQRLIENLAYLYFSETGQEAGLSRARLHYDRDSDRNGTPGGHSIGSLTLRSSCWVRRRHRNNLR